MRLTEKQYRFAVKFVECDNASEAYRFAYNCERMKPATINRNAHELLKNNNVATRIDLLRQDARDKLSQKYHIDQEKILREFYHIAFFDVTKLFDDEGHLLPICELDESTKLAVSSIDIDTIRGLEGGDTVTITSKLKAIDKLGALKEVAKIFGMYEKDNIQKRAAPVVERIVEQTPAAWEPEGTVQALIPDKTEENKTVQ